MPLRDKISSAPSVLSRLKKLTGNSTARRVAASSAAGAAAGGVYGGMDTGEEKALEALKGALAGGVMGAVMGSYGPIRRSILDSRADKNTADGLRVLGIQQKIIEIIQSPIGKTPAARKKVVELGKDYEKILKKYPGADNKSRLQNLKKKIPEMRASSRSLAKKEIYAAPTLSSLVGAGLGFGLSHDAKEQEKYRRSKK